MMPRMFLRALTCGVALLSALFLLMQGCEQEPPSALYTPGGASGAQPVITSILPATGAVAGLTQLQLNGSNFSTNPAEDFVYFDTARANILSATPNVLTFWAPVVVKDSIQVRVGVGGATLFSVPFVYGLKSPVPILDSLNTNEDPRCLTHDASGDLLASIEPSPAGASVGIFTPAGGTRTVYSPAFPGTAKSYSGMKMGPGGVLYGVFRQNRIVTVASQGAAAQVWVNVGARTKTLTDLDFDSLKNVWVAGSNDSVFSVTPAKVVKSFPFVSGIRSVRVFRGYLYLGGNVNNDEGVWRFPLISSDNLGPVEQYFDFGATYPAAGRVNAITFAADGDLYIGCDDQLSMVVVHPDRTSGQLYPGLLKLQSVNLSWGPGNELFVARHDSSSALVKQHAIVRVNMQKPGAPYYGIQ